ncbi:glycosyl hydrolase family 17 protein [Seonamhaeicola sp. ML3]|uniref:glycoside hydrolase family 17 protein n=1 Tax=Seonamhaeicola sp. ML3 TaxID=2937786 RepID=UPI00200C10D8|nr:glycosyl hydrolase family 17 protein [Seonamhaeicola sp. ML3]
MSRRSEKFLTLASIDFQNKSIDELKKVFKDTLNMGMYGLCFSPYTQWQKPGDQLSEAQIRRRLEIIKPYTKWIRTFSCTEGNELIPVIAKELGIKTLVGAWLGENEKTNNLEVNNLIQLCNNGYADIAAVGNEVMYRGDLTQEELLDFIYYSKSKIDGIPVGYVDAYYEFTDRLEITEACDIILANCYPFWEGCDQDYALLYMKDMYNRAKKAGNGKPVIITETGWPSEGTALQGAFPSKENAMKYFIASQQWSFEEDIPMFYFSSFDENWKVGAEGDVGAFWGLWGTNEQLKF